MIQFVVFKEAHITNTKCL